jgi:hypothetical protein
MICPEGIDKINRSVTKKVNDTDQTGLSDILFGMLEQ